VEAVKNQMGGFAIGRQIRKNAKSFELQEPQPVYNAFFKVEKNDIETENLWFWNL
jgi:hypothetical protein